MAKTTASAAKPGVKASGRTTRSKLNKQSTANGKKQLTLHYGRGDNRPKDVIKPPASSAKPEPMTGIQTQDANAPQQTPVKAGLSTKKTEDTAVISPPGAPPADTTSKDHTMKDTELSPNNTNNLQNPLNDSTPAIPPEPKAPEVGKVTIPTEGDPASPRNQNQGAEVDQMPIPQTETAAQQTQPSAADQAQKAKEKQPSKVIEEATSVTPMKSHNTLPPTTVDVTPATPTPILDRTGSRNLPPPETQTTLPWKLVPPRSKKKRSSTSDANP